jgi:hypothetical protein
MPAARRRPEILAAGARWRPPPFAVLTMIAPSGRLHREG